VEEPEEELDGVPVPHGWLLGRSVPVVLAHSHSQSGRPVAEDVVARPDLRIGHHYNVGGCHNAAAAVGHNAAAVGHNLAAVFHNAASRTRARIHHNRPFRLPS
jgi:hypothetical protein